MKTEKKVFIGRDKEIYCIIKCPNFISLKEDDFSSVVIDLGVHECMGTFAAAIRM